MTTARRVAPRPYAGILEALRRHRLMVSAVTVLYLVTYLWSIGDLVVTATGHSRFGAAPSIQVAADWPAKLLRQTAPFSYEPVLAARLTGHIQLFLAPVNVALGLLLGGLAGANLAAAIHLYRTAATCRRRSLPVCSACFPDSSPASPAAPLPSRSSWELRSRQFSSACATGCSRSHS